MVEVEFDVYGDWIPHDIEKYIESAIREDVNVCWGDPEIGSEGAMLVKFAKVQNGERRGESPPASIGSEGGGVMVGPTIGADIRIPLRYRWRWFWRGFFNPFADPETMVLREEVKQIIEDQFFAERMAYRARVKNGEVSDD